MTDTSITNSTGVLAPNALRRAVRAGLRTSANGPILPWHIIWVALGRRGVVMVRRERRGRVEVQVVEPSTLNADVTLTLPDGSSRVVTFREPTKLERAARAFLALRLLVWSYLVMAWWRVPVLGRLRPRLAARWRYFRVWVRWRLRRR